MTDVHEHTVRDLIVKIDRLICVGFGDCIEASPDAFELDEEGIAVLKETVASVSAEELIASCESCPVDALMVFDSDGEQLVP